VRAPRENDATTAPPGSDAINPKTGAPVGIDKGWAYAPGASVADELRAFAQAKGESLPEELARAFLLSVLIELLRARL